MCTPGAGGAGIREQEDSERRGTSFRGVAERGERERGCPVSEFLVTSHRHVRCSRVQLSAHARRLILHRYQTGAPLLEHAYDDG